MKPFAIVLGLLFLTGCRYENGPKVSFRSPSARITGIWLIDKVLENGVERTNEFNLVFPNYKLEIKTDDTYTITSSNTLVPGESGSWELSADKMRLILKKNGTGRSEWNIRRLTAKEFHASQLDGGKTVEYQLRARN
jgi:hypothetical protein